MKKISFITEKGLLWFVSVDTTNKEAFTMNMTDKESEATLMSNKKAKSLTSMLRKAGAIS